MLSNKTTLRYMEDYTSESEVLVFDTVKVNKIIFNHYGLKSVLEILFVFHHK